MRTLVPLTVASLLLFLLQAIILYHRRARKEHDIYARSLYVAFASLAASLPLGMLYLANGNAALLLAAGWLLFAGFCGFMITGHLYKIVPFLVWFERFSPRVGKEKVPLLAEMLPAKSADAQLLFAALGVGLSAAGLLLGSNLLFRAGASALVVGALFLLYSILYIVRYR